MQTGDIIDEIVDFVLAILPGSNADVAQLVEQRFRKPQVTGSNPVVGSSPESFRRQGRYIHRPQESSADASRHTWLELSPRTTTITSLPGRAPLAIKHLPAASV